MLTASLKSHGKGAVLRTLLSFDVICINLYKFVYDQALRRS